MALSEHEQRQLDAIELALARDARRPPIRLEPRSCSAIAIQVLIGALVVTIAVVLTFSRTYGLTLLIGCGLLATIVGLHRYDANHG